ncbi:sigma-24, ECF subfamily [Candidatus Koribacter versatilis Ellin345]|uniref:Sigma-24, ECF subfamily n=1 Tax=Koribacter versatilis (strain Ellin345) TaxID=204669 RepID=Q1IQM4_KORVE|nr:RNA polymerase sigma factor [Candidatus Koribacter versatilis]ABF40826.1 sigma-24, ECF subfamily [Candidatus Koribacter versatilis Ellin345]
MDSETRTRDEWLALRCQTNEDGAYDALVSTLEMPLLYYAFKLTGNRDRALDVLQEAWIRAFRGMRKLKDPGSLRPWLYSIVHGVAIDDLRRGNRREAVESPELETDDIAEPASFDADDARAIHDALDKLEPSHREVLTLFFLEGFTVSETAGIVGCAEGTVKSRLHYAKKALRKIMDGENNA